MGAERVERITGRGMPIRGNDIDTDRIIPARFLKAITFEGLEGHVFADDRREARAAGGVHPVDDPRYQGASVYLVNANFGCGSSREHAPQAIRRNDVRAIVGESFSEIFFGNSIALGMPCLTAPAATVRALQDAVDARPQVTIDIDLHGMTVSAGDQRYPVSLPPAVREAFLDGSWDATGLLLDDFAAVRATADRLPYITSRWPA